MIVQYLKWQYLVCPIETGTALMAFLFLKKKASCKYFVVKIEDGKKEKIVKEENSERRIASAVSTSLLHLAAYLK